MSTLIDRYVRATDGFAQRLQAIRPDQWNEPTPCTDWDVRALVAHVHDEQLWIPPLLAGETIAGVGDRFAGDQLGDDPVQAWSSARQLALEAASSEASLRGLVHLSYGDEQAETYLWQVTSDSLIHSWDLARAIGAWERLDPDCVDAVTEFLTPQIAGWRNAGAFAAAVAEPADADPQARLLAMTGRG